MIVGFLSHWRVDDPRAWSGVIKPMCEHLARRVDLVPLTSADVRDGFVDRAALRLLGDRFGTYLPGHAVHTALRHGRVMSRRVAEAGVDVVLAVAASQDVAFLAGEVPVVQVSDTTFTAIRGYYPLYTNLSPLLLPQARLLTRRANARISHTVAATEWARDALIRDDGLDPASITVAPFGPAIPAPADLDRHPFDPDRPRLLLVASDWERKGGDLALAAFERVRRDRPEATLTIVGQEPAQLPDGVMALGRVDRAVLAGLYASHDVLLELASSNASGVTLTDAAGFGLPVVATRTGGVGSIVEDGESGLLVDPTASIVDDAAVAVLQVCQPEMHARLSAGARSLSGSLLSWDRWGAHMARVLSRAVR